MFPPCRLARRPIGRHGLAPEVRQASFRHRYGSATAKCTAVRLTPNTRSPEDLSIEDRDSLKRPPRRPTSPQSIAEWIGVGQTRRCARTGWPSCWRRQTGSGHETGGDDESFERPGYSRGKPIGAKDQSCCGDLHARIRREYRVRAEVSHAATMLSGNRAVNQVFTLLDVPFCVVGRRPATQ
jgi:hypothetical protein